MKIDQESLANLSALEYVPGKLGHVKIVEQLDRGAYTKLNKVLEALGGKWSKKDKAHVFDGANAQIRIDHAITTGEVETGQDVGWFPTPRALADRLVDLACEADRETTWALEPSAGDGAIVRALSAAGFEKAEIIAVERDEKRRNALRAAGLCTVDNVDDFMDLTLAGNDVDIVVMNPPFCRVGKGDHLDHVRHAFAQLLPGGRLVSVLPASVSFRRDRRHADFRGWVLEHGEIEPLPERSFKESGTDVSTVVVRMVKP